MIASFCGLPLQGRSQSHLYTWKADYVGQAFGIKLSSAGDVDGDGFDDVVIGTDWDTTKSVTGDGVRVFSGRDGSLIFAVQMQTWGPAAVAGAGDLDRDGKDEITFIHTSRRELWYVSVKSTKPLRTVSLAGFRSPTAIAEAGDVDKDGYPDLLIGDPTYGTSGRAAVISGRDGSLIHDFKVGGANYNWFGAAVAGAEDVDGDGYADFLVSDPLYGTYQTSLGYGRCWLYSGRTGLVLRTFYELKNRGMVFGQAVRAIGDVDRDGVSELAVGAPGTSVNGLDSGAVFVYSGKSGQLLHSIYGKQARWYLGHKVAPAGDWNLDGTPDLAVGAIGESSNALLAGAVFVYSCKDWKVLASFHGTNQWQGLGGSLSGGGDLDGDGRIDLFFGMPQFAGTTPLLRWEVRAWSPVQRTLWSDTHKVSLKNQGQQQLHLDAGIQHAGSTYFLLGSMSGIQPGLKLGSHLLPLQVDTYFWLTATVPNSSFLQGSLGLLDSQGKAKASFTAVAGMPQALIGQRADHAYLVFGKGGITMTSNWVPLLFAK